MAFEKEIKAAQKLVGEWLARSKKDHEFFVGMKKSGVTWEKDSLKLVEQRIKANEMKEAVDLIEGGYTWLDDYTKQCIQVFELHDKFIMGAPRAGSQGICKTLKIEEDNPAYKAVLKATEKDLIVLGKQFSETQSAWRDDLKLKIDIIRSKYKTLEKLAKGKTDELPAYAKQFLRDRQTFKQQMETALAEFKTDSAQSLLVNLQKDPKTWAGGNPKFRLDHYTNMRKFLAASEGMLKICAKNYNRVVKSLPDDVKTKGDFARLLTEFEKDYKKIEKEIELANYLFKQVVTAIEWNFPELK